MQFIHELFNERVKQAKAQTHAQASEREFLYLKDETLTLAQLSVLVDSLEAELKDLDVRAGDRVLIVAENCPQQIALILACSRVGAWSCGVNARMSKGEVAGFALKADPRVVYFTDAISDSAKAHAADFYAKPSSLSGLLRSEVRTQAIAEPSPLAEQVATIIFTSGTTGTPKGVLVSHAGLLQFARVSAESRALDASDRSYAYLPMTHIFGLATVLMASLYAGSSLVIRSTFDPADVFDALATKALTQLQGPPAMFTRLLSWLDEQNISTPAAPHLRYLYTGAAPMDMALKQAVEKRFAKPLHHGYGLSEYAGALCLVRMNEPRDDTSAGYLVDGGELRIVNSDGVDQLKGETAEIWMRGVGLMPGYFRDTEATKQVIREGGWYASGDLGYVAEDGALFVVGRLKEMIIRSGFNVYPGEVESVLCNFPGVQRAAVVGKKTHDGNEDVIAFIEPVSGLSPDLVALKQHIENNLAPYKRPSQLLIKTSFPMTFSGKILKRQLLADLDIDRQANA
jgi:acyl-CoA synthetase (AMP-forming)/AMP-acid ligase II